MCISHNLEITLWATTSRNTHVHNRNIANGWNLEIPKMLSIVEWKNKLYYMQIMQHYVAVTINHMQSNSRICFINIILSGKKDKRGHTMWLIKQIF